MENTIKTLSFEESMLFKDHGISDRTMPSLGGFVVIKDAETGEVLLAKKNLVVRRGRELTLRRAFAISGSVAGETDAALKDKSVLLFGIGTGGDTADPFVPVTPSPSDTTIESVAFRVTSVLNPMTTTDALKYTDGIAETGNTIGWYKKKFTNGNGVLTVDPANDSVSVLLNLQISSLDARDRFINELGLYYARYTPAGIDQNSKYGEYSLFSRITFPTEPLPSASSKALDIDYYVYL